MNDLEYSSVAQLNALNEAIDHDDDNEDLYYKRAKYFFDNNAYGSAEKDLQMVFKLNPKKSDAWVLSSNLNYKLNNTSKSLNHANKALSLGNRNPELYTLLSLNYLKLKDTVSSKRFLLTLQSIAPHITDVQHINGLLSLQRNDTLKAKYYFTYCVNKNTNDIDSYLLLMDIYYRKNQLDSLMPMLIKVRSRTKCNPNLFLYEAKYYEKQKFFLAAKALYEEGFSCNAYATVLYYPYAELLSQLGLYKESINYYGKVVNDKNIDQKILLTKMADNCKKSNDYAGALVYYKDLFALDTTQIVIEKNIKSLQVLINSQQSQRDTSSF
jgi:tetratricopeptide (TPR) repeat protein